MIRVSSFLSNPKADISPICFRVNFKGKYTRLATGLSLETKYWNSTNKKISIRSKQAHSLNKEMSRLEALIYDLADKNTDNKGTLDLTALAKTYRGDLSGTISQKGGIFINDAFNLYIDDCLKKKEKKRATAKVYRTIQNKINSFELVLKKNYRVENINKKYLDEFKLYLLEDFKNTNITVHKHFKILKSLTRFLIAEGHNVNRDIFGFTISYNDTKKVTFNNSDMRRLMDVELKTKNHIKYRDLFIILCNTGLRISDLKKLNESHVNDKEKLICIYTDKTDTPVEIPVSDMIISLIRKYFISNSTNIIDQKFNKIIKEICQLAGINEDVELVHEYGKERIRKIYKKCDLVKTHTGRRTFITKMMETGLLTESELMRISGHTTIAAFRKYYQLDDIFIQKKCRQIVDKGLFEE